MGRAGDDPTVMPGVGGRSSAPRAAVTPVVTTRSTVPTLLRSATAVMLSLDPDVVVLDHR